ncbi:MAG TPA: SDR family NAD(P)-dependent oxidoreductase [Rhizomicrobium sp.]|nr:SDR family NAD(P)-dependent oxidoreductase [Rhizomicrobium sp.]
MTLKDKRALVIGGGSGTGLGVARGAAREGADVLIASRDAEKIAAAAKNIGATSAAIDMRDENNVKQFFKDNSAFDHIAFTAGDWESLMPGAVAVAKHGATKLPPGGSYTITNGMLAHRPMKGMPTVAASASAVGIGAPAGVFRALNGALESA